jgi:hypothetical protein
MDINKIFQSKVFQGVIIALAILIIALMIFKAGMIIGERKADFSCRWNDNYHRNFAGPREGFMRGWGDRDFIESNGVFGQILKIEGNNIVIKGRNDVENVIVTNDKTVIKRFNETVKISDLKTDESIVVIGEANSQGQIEAKLIRLMPVPPENMPQPPLNIPLNINAN